MRFFPCWIVSADRLRCNELHLRWWSRWQRRLATDVSRDARGLPGELAMAAGTDAVWLAWPDSAQGREGVLWRLTVRLGLVSGKPFHPCCDSIALLPDGTNLGWIYADEGDAGRGVTMHVRGTLLESRQVDWSQAGEWRSHP